MLIIVRLGVDLRNNAQCIYSKNLNRSILLYIDTNEGSLKTVDFYLSFFRGRTSRRVAQTKEI